MLIPDDFIKHFRFYRMKTSEIKQFSLYLKTLIFLRFFTKNVSSSRVFEIFPRRLLQLLGKTDCQVGMI